MTIEKVQVRTPAVVMRYFEIPFRQKIFEPVIGAVPVGFSGIDQRRRVFSDATLNGTLLSSQPEFVCIPVRLFSP